MENRIIKFRAWTDLGLMIEPYCELKPEDDNSFWAEDRTNPPYNYCSVLAVMQFTGLKDKNGVEIYEGDIVQYSMPDMAGEDIWYTEEVNFMDGGFMLDGSAPVSLIDDASGQVIGNIFQNPELLTR